MYEIGGFKRIDSTLVTADKTKSQVFSHLFQPVVIQSMQEGYLL